MRRREFLRSGGLFLAGSWLGANFMRTANAGVGIQAGPGPYGGLQDPDANGIMLPPGFTSRVLAEAGVEVAGTGFTWHPFPDGGAVFHYGSQHVYVSNSEFPLIANGGASAILFDEDGTIVDAYSILSGTIMNCAGGATNWGTWLSCEEHNGGRVWECDPLGVNPARRRLAMGRFQHEAVAQDLTDPRRFYLTEDRPDGGFYRFTSDVAGDLTAGLLEIAEVVPDGSGNPGGTVVWHEVPDPVPPGQGVQTRHQVPESAPFNGGEGIVWTRTLVYFTTKGDDRVWSFDPWDSRLCVHYDAALDPGQQLTGVDNITAARNGELYVAEDGGNMEIVMLSREGTASPLLRIVDQPGSEIAGPAFDRDHQRLYVSSQRGGAGGAGLTYVIEGPFRGAFGC